MRTLLLATTACLASKALGERAIDAKLVVGGIHGKSGDEEWQQAETGQGEIGDQEDANGGTPKESSETNGSSANQGSAEISIVQMAFEGTDGSDEQTTSSSTHVQAGPEGHVITVSHEAPSTALTLPSTCLRHGDIALTFDDGPGLYTEDLLQALKDTDVKATFHLSNAMLEDEHIRHIAKDIMNAGHNVGLRFDTTLTADDLNAMTPDQFRAKLISESDAIYAALGRHPRFIRMPWGYRYIKNKSFAQLIFRMGFIVTGWTLDAHDYNVERSQREEILKNIYKPIVKASEDAGGKMKESFIVLHRDMMDTADAVKEGIEMVKATNDERVRFVTLAVCLGTDQPYKQDAQALEGFLNKREDKVERDYPSDTADGRDEDSEMKSRTRQPVIAMPMESEDERYYEAMPMKSYTDSSVIAMPMEAFPNIRKMLAESKASIGAKTQPFMALLAAIMALATFIG